MRMIGLLCVGVATVALTACSTVRSLDVPPSAFKCTNDADCVITVSVTPACVISVDRPDVEIMGRDRAIHWELDKAAVDLNFRFDTHNGVVLKAVDPENQFYDKVPHGANRKYHWRDKNNNYAKPTPYDYAINIEQLGPRHRARHWTRGSGTTDQRTIHEGRHSEELNGASRTTGFAGVRRVQRAARLADPHMGRMQMRMIGLLCVGIGAALLTGCSRQEMQPLHHRLRRCATPAATSS